MLATKEITSTPIEAFSLTKAFDFLKLQELKLALASKTKALKEKFFKQPKLWQSESYFDPKTPQEQKLGQLFNDLLTFYEEYVGFLKQKIYPYSTFGLPGGKQIPISQQFQTQVEFLAKNGLETRRAEAEVIVAKRLEAWLQDPNIPQGGMFISISPRGKISEGYPGTNPRNYIFINIYKKTGPNEAVLTQYLSFALNPELLEFLKTLQSDFAAKPYSLHQLGFEPNSDALKIINSTLIIPADPASLPKLEALIYAHKDKFPLDLETDFPQLDKDLFARELDRLIKFNLKIYEELLVSDLSQAEKATRLDLLIQISREAFLAWTEAHSPNYQKDPQQEIIYTPLDLAKIKQRFELELKKQTGQKLSKQENKKLVGLQVAHSLNAFGALFRLGSIAHCAVGTPTSLVKIGNQAWKVPNNYGVGKGIHLGSHGEVLGPCGIPLANDPFAQLVSDGEQIFEHDIGSGKNYPQSKRGFKNIVLPPVGLGKFVASLI